MIDFLKNVELCSGVINTCMKIRILICESSIPFVVLLFVDRKIVEGLNNYNAHIQVAQETSGISANWGIKWKNEVTRWLLFPSVHSRADIYY